MFNLDLKRAETALQAGRLEDAWQILSASPARGHAKAQQLTDQLVIALIERSEEHLVEKDLVRARHDAELAKRIGGGQLRVAQVLRKLDEERVSINHEATRRREKRIQDEISGLIAGGNDEDAINRFHQLKQPGPIEESTRALLAPSVKNLTERAKSDLLAGRLDRCERTLRLFRHAKLWGMDQQDLKIQLDQCYNVSRAVERSEYAEASRELKLLARNLPDATWISEMIESVEVCLDRVEYVKAGPFGLLESLALSQPKRQAFTASVRRGKSVRMNNTSSQNNFFREQLRSKSRSILQVDQLGSLLLVAGDICSVGAATTSNCDVILQTEGSKDRVLICRDGEDYFATSQQAFFVNDLLAERHLLNHGDTIHVGKRGRLKYSRPVSASSTAVLQIVGSKMKRRDVRAIVLIDDAIMFGHKRGHFRLPNFDPPVILRAEAGAGGDFLVHQQGEREHKLFRQDSNLMINHCQFSLSSLPSTRGTS